MGWAIPLLFLPVGYESYSSSRPEPQTSDKGKKEKNCPCGDGVWEGEIPGIREEIIGVNHPKM